MLKSYEALRTRIDRHIASVRARYTEQIICRPTCTDCCEAGLTLVMVEAVAIGRMFDIEPERVYLQAGQPSHFNTGRCAMLTADNLCGVYGERPLICRTHGLPLIYPESKEMTYCEKNFLSRAPHISAALDMNNLETALFAVNLDYCRKSGINPMSRVAIDRLAALVAAAKKNQPPE
jgi:Fe-S-cluster containining protein